MIAKINYVSTKKYLPVVVTSAIGYTKFEHELGNLESPLYHRAYAPVPTQNCPVASSSLRANRFDSKKNKIRVPKRSSYSTFNFNFSCDNVPLQEISIAKKN